MPCLTHLTSARGVYWVTERQPKCSPRCSAKLLPPVDTADGFVVFLTNNPRYWNPGRDQSGDVGAAFRIHQGRRLTGTIAWAAHTAQGTMGKHSAPIILKREYVA